jgi:hypothetical protein
MIYLITNLEHKNNDALCNIIYVYHNPWGFSRSNIKYELFKKIESLNITDSDIVFFAIKPFFFGNRSEIIKDALKTKCKNVRIVNLKDSQSKIKIESNLLNEMLIF